MIPVNVLKDLRSFESLNATANGSNHGFYRFSPIHNFTLPAVWQRVGVSAPGCDVGRCRDGFSFLDQFRIGIVWRLFIPQRNAGQWQPFDLNRFRDWCDRAGSSFK